MSRKRPSPNPIARAARGERGQAAVESALILPMLLFTLLGILQLVLAYQARILTEYAAFKAARAASVYRLDCTHMRNAALIALLPSMGMASPPSDLTAHYVALARQAVGSGSANRAPRANTPLVLVDYKLENRLPMGEFDRPLAGDADPMKVRVRVAYFYEYRIPFANFIMTRFWLATQTGTRWAQSDPTIAVHRAETPNAVKAIDDELLSIAQLNISRKYYSTPIVSTFSLRMMSDPLRNAKNQDRCQ